MRFVPIILRSVYFLLTSLIVVAPALYNRYPLMYFDSGAYMEMSKILEPSFHRAFGYPLLMKLTGLGFTHWPIILLQGVVISMLLDRIVRRFIDEQHRRWAHFLTILLLSFTSSLAWYAAQLMPDVWTFILVLGIAALILEPTLTWSKLACYAALLLVSMLTHLSHIPLMLLLLASFVSMHFISRKQFLRLGLFRWSVLGGSMVAAMLVVCSFNAAHHLGFRLSLASNAFLTANFGEMGILKLYLDENCPDAPKSLCAIKDQMPLETYGYLWDPNGPVQQHEGGWEGANDAYAAVVHDFLTKPRYMKWLMYASIKSTVQQMAQIELGSGLQYAYGEGSPPQGAMSRHFKQELNEYMTSVQNKGDDLPLDFFKIVHYISIFLSLLIIGRAVLMRQLSVELAILLVIFVLAYFFNAAITGVMANVYERLQCRLLPLLQLLAILVILKPIAHFQLQKPD